MRELFPESELRKLPPDHAVWYAEEKVDPKHLPEDPQFWLWGLDACCRTSIVAVHIPNPGRVSTTLIFGWSRGCSRRDRSDRDDALIVGPGGIASPAA